MDLGLYLRILWRFRVIVASGAALAALLAVMTAARIDFDGLRPTVTYRQSEEWLSTATVFVTQEGFPLGRAIYDEFVPLPEESETSVTPRFSDPSRFAGYAALFARLATSDEVRAMMLRRGPIDGTITARPAVVENASLLPVIEISALSSSRESAIRLARRASGAFLQYVEAEQEASNIPADRRVVLELVNNPREAALVTPRRLTRPAFVFIAVMSAVVLLAFALENVRPRVRVAVRQELDVITPVENARKSA